MLKREVGGEMKEAFLLNEIPNRSDREEKASFFLFSAGSSMLRLVEEG